MIRVGLYTQDPKIHPLLSAPLRREYSLLLATDFKRLEQIAERGEADLLVLDFDSNYVPREEQLSFCERIREKNLPTVIMTDDLRRSSTIDFLQRGVCDCIRKPPSLIEFKIITQRAYEHAAIQKELDAMRQAADSSRGCDRLVGSSGRTQVVYDLIRRVANIGASVLITGESGTGKELVARAIHNLGNRAQHPFVPVSCGAIPETLIESELFGHEKGAFTGSTGARAGYLEQAGEGTLFLDEIGELSPSTQVKLLRVLQEREFTRLGSNRPIPLKARVVFATHRDLEKMVEEGSFRRDLYFRVNIMTIHVPPLRERTEDIPALARHFLKRYASEYGKPVLDIPPDALEVLVEYDWPGNIRELENAIQSAVILTDGEALQRCDLPETVRAFSDDIPHVTGGDSADDDSFEKLMRQYKVHLANKAIGECNGNKAMAARKLKVSRAYLHRLIRLRPGRPEQADFHAEVA